jgi:hypothetical protein
MRRPRQIIHIRRLNISLHIKALPNLARINRQRLLAAPPRVITPFASRARDRGDRAVAVVRAVAKRHGLQRHAVAVAARPVFWDVVVAGRGARGAARHVEAAAHAELLEGEGDEGAEGCDAAGGDADAVFDGGPDCYADGLDCGIVSLLK